MVYDVHRYHDIKHMPTSSSLPRYSLVRGGDEYLNAIQVRQLRDSALQQYPDAEVLQYDATQIDKYTFEQAVTPSLLSNASIVILDNMQSAEEPLAQTIAQYCQQTHADDTSIVIMRAESGNKGKRILDMLRKAGVHEITISDFRKPQERIAFINEQFKQHERTVTPQAAQQLSGVFENRTGELAAMIEQLCFDFDDNPIDINRVNQYLITDPQVSGFTVADYAISGNTQQAIIAARHAIEQGIEPIALIGALAMKLRQMAKYAAFEHGIIQDDPLSKTYWLKKRVKQQLQGWTSAGMSTCIRMLAWADEQCKTTGNDPYYALERCVETISSKGITHKN